MADAAALVLALTIDPERAAANLPMHDTQTPADSPASPNPGANPTPAVPVPADGSASAPGPNASAPASPPRTETRDRAVRGAAPSAPPRPWRWAVAASAAVDGGTLRAAAPGLDVRVALAPGGFPALRFELGAAVFLDESIRNPSERSAVFSLRSFDAAGCLVGRLGRFEGGGCTGVEVEWVSAAGIGESTTERGDAAWAVIPVQARAAYAFSNAWALASEAGAGVNLARPEFVSVGVGQGLIDRPARFTGRANLGIELRF